MDELLDSLSNLIGNKSDDIDNSLELEWNSKEAINQAHNNQEVFGDPDYVNRNQGGSIRWFDISEPMVFSEVMTEDQPTSSILRALPYQSSFTLMLRINNIHLVKRLPKDFYTYNHNYGRLTCHCSNWKEAVILAAGAHLMDLGYIEKPEILWDAWKDIDDPTPFVKFLVDDHEESEEYIETPISTIQTPVAPISPIKKEDLEPTPPKEEEVEKEEKVVIPIRNIKSPLGKPVGRVINNKQSPPRSPIKTIVGKVRHSPTKSPIRRPVNRK